MATLAESLQEKEYDPERMLIISVEESREITDEFWTSVPVKSTLPKNVILHRIILDEDEEEYELLESKYDVSRNTSLYIIGANSTIISHSWKEGFPEPIEFAEYISGTQVGAYTFDDQQQTIENMENEVSEDFHPNEKKVKIQLIMSGGIKMRTFSESSTIADLNAWLDEEAGTGHTFTIAHNNQDLPTEQTATLKEAGLAPSSLLRIKEGDLSQITRGEGRFHTDNRCWGKFVKSVKLAFSFVNPFADEGEQEDFWEYQPSNNPEISNVVARNVFG